MRGGGAKKYIGDKPIFFRASPLLYIYTYIALLQNQSKYNPHFLSPKNIYKGNMYVYICDCDLLATFSDQITPLRIFNKIAICDLDRDLLITRSLGDMHWIYLGVKFPIHPSSQVVVILHYFAVKMPACKKIRNKVHDVQRHTLGYTGCSGKRSPTVRRLDSHWSDNSRSRCLLFKTITGRTNFIIILFQKNCSNFDCTWINLIFGRKVSILEHIIG